METNESLRRKSETTKMRYSKGELIGSFTGRHHSEETKKSLSYHAKKNGLGGVPKWRKQEYNGIMLGSSYEVKVAKSLDANNIKWVVPKCVHYTDMNGKQHRYTADFYLPDYDVYLDPKNSYLISSVHNHYGYTDVQKIEMVQQQNNIRVLILTEEQLSWDYIKMVL